MNRTTPMAKKIAVRVAITKGRPRTRGYTLLISTRPGQTLKARQRQRSNPASVLTFVMSILWFDLWDIWY